MNVHCAFLFNNIRHEDTLCILAIMKMQTSAFVGLLLAAVSLPYCLACIGYQIASQNIESCDPNAGDIITLDGFKLILNDDCTVNVDGCVELTKQITSAKGSYKVKKGVFTLNGKKDICKELEKAKDDVHDVFKYMKVKESCPIEPIKACGPPEAFNITKYKGYLSMLKGKAVANLTLEANSGNTCVKAAIQIVKVKK